MVAEASDFDALDVDIDRLIADARLLQRHLADRGKLPDTSLGDAIDALASSRGGPEADRMLASLSVQYSNAINLTEKTSIDTLPKAHGQLYPKGWANIRQIVTASIAIVLIFLAVLGFVIVQEINDNIAALQRINLQESAAETHGAPQDRLRGGPQGPEDGVLRPVSEGQI